MIYKICPRFYTGVLLCANKKTFLNINLYLTDYKFLSKILY